MVILIFLLLLLPLAGFLINIFFGGRLKSKGALISVFAALNSLIICGLIFNRVIRAGDIGFSFCWFSAGSHSFDAGIFIDPLSALMLILVSFIGLLVQIYSMGYMPIDKGYGSFFAYLSLFIFAMQGLVMADNLILLYVFWELVGVCSYLLISFWYKKKEAADAGKKAFIINRIADTGLLIGVFWVFYYFRTTNFREIGGILNQGPGVFDSFALTVCAVLIFCGAAAKSAQFPLHVWLPEAMEGPTPASALIHAATMVAAGIYLIARSYFIFAAGSLSLEIISYVGIITALMAASIAIVENDVKRILAYSTISQLGYMMLALGVGGYGFGIFHLMTHGFFKALLFLCAGSIIHAAGTQDIRRMGGLFKSMKITALASFTGYLAIAGVPPFSGFWSKDGILTAVYSKDSRFLYPLAVLASFMTAFYMSRFIILIFLGKPRDELVHGHDPCWAMAWPLIILAVFSAFSGFAGSALTGNYFSRIMRFHNENLKGSHAVMFSSLSAVFLGILFAWMFYIAFPGITRGLKERFRFIYNLLLNKYWIDRIYGLYVIAPFLSLSKIGSYFDSRIINSAVDFTALAAIALSRTKSWVEIYIVDGVFNFIGSAVMKFSLNLKKLQLGFFQNHILLVFASLVIIVLFGLM